MTYQLGTSEPSCTCSFHSHWFPFLGIYLVFRVQ